jgi:tRNA wybutosine-synthesizing protein 3
MAFQEQKSKYLEALNYPDKSRAGSCDPQILPLLDHINDLDDFYTTSSCAGRLMLIEKHPEGKKFEANWMLVSHDAIEYQQIWQTLHQRIEQPDYEVWFKMEAPIIHLCARDLESAQWFLAHCKAVGLKHAAIMGTTPRVMLEIMGRTAIETLLCVDGQILINEYYIETMIKKANKKLQLARQPFNQLLYRLRNNTTKR